MNESRPIATSGEQEIETSGDVSIDASRWSGSQWGDRGTAAVSFASRLSFEDVSLKFGEYAAVNKVSFDLNPGEIICLLGPSGCGKTSLLRLAAGIEIPDHGRIIQDGKVVSGGAKHVPPEKRHVGLMFQDFALFPHMTVLDNVMFGLKHLAKKDAKTEAARALQRVGLETYSNNYPHELSGGEQQRVALARAIVPRPSVVLMDEPFSGLDRRLRDSVRLETLALLRETRASAMLVTHDPEEALGMADRIILMRAGKIIQTGTPSEIYKNPADVEVARFLGDINEIPCEVKAGKIKTPVGKFSAKEAPEGHELTAVLRNHCFQATKNDPDGTKGYISNVRFLGDCHELHVHFPGVEKPVCMNIRALEEPVIGGEIEVKIKPECVLLFES